MPDLAWALITLARRIYDMIAADKAAADIKADARDQLDAAIDNAIAKRALAKRRAP